MSDTNRNNSSLDKTIDALFSDVPGEPISPKEAVSAPAPRPVTPATEKTVQVSPPAPKAPVSRPAGVQRRPVRPTAAPKAEAPKTEAAPAPKTEAAPAPKAEAPSAPVTAPKAPAAKSASAKTPVNTGTISISELKKLMANQRVSRPVEKTPVWSILMTVCTLMLSMSIAGIAVIACFFYFGPGSPAAAGKPLVGYVSMVMCIVVCAVFVGFAMGIVFMLRKIEKDIREIKSKL